MKIGVISDTHIPGSGCHPKKLASRYLNRVSLDSEALCSMLRPYFSDVDMVIHAGDFVSWKVVTALEEFGPVEGVAGNMDPYEISSRLPRKKVVNAGGFRIGLMHGWGSPQGLELKIRREFDQEKVDCIVFGHSHNPFQGEVEGVLMVNPGSPTDQRWAPTRSIAVLRLEQKIEAELVPLD